MFAKQHYDAIAGALLNAQERYRRGEIGLATIDFAIEHELIALFTRHNPAFDGDEFSRKVHPGWSHLPLAEEMS